MKLYAYILMMHCTLQYILHFHTNVLIHIQDCNVMCTYIYTYTNPLRTYLCLLKLLTMISNGLVWLKMFKCCCTQLTLFIVWMYLLLQISLLIYHFCFCYSLNWNWSLSLNFHLIMNISVFNLSMCAICLIMKL